MNREKQPLLLLFTSLFFLLALRPIEAFDTFWQLQSGKYIWQTGRFIYSDIFSIAYDEMRIEHCWFSDIIFYGLYSLGGYTLLSLLKPAAIALCAALLYWWNKKNDVDATVSFALMSLCLAASEPSWLVRPQLWTFVFSLLFLILLYHGRKVQLRAWLWLSPIMLLWANMHAACIFGFVLAGIFFTGELLRCYRKEVDRAYLKRLLLALALILPASLINPYGYKIPLMLFGHIQLHELENPLQLGVMEWLPPTFAQTPLFYIVMSLWAIILLVRWRRIDASETLFFIAFLYMGLSQIRHTTLVALLAAFFMPASAQEVFLSISKGGQKKMWKIAVSAITLLLLAIYIFDFDKAGTGLHDKSYPAKATDFLIENKLEKNIYNSYDWGGYLMWRLYPEYLVFVDGRSGSKDTFNASTKIDNLLQGWEAELDSFDIKTLITRTCYSDTGGPIPLIDALTDSNKWALVYSDDTALIFIRKGPASKGFAELPGAAAYRTMQTEARRLYGQDSSRTRALLAIGRSSLRLAEYQKAAEYYDLFLKKTPENKEARAMLDYLAKMGIRP